MRIDGTISGDQGANVPVSSPFAVAGCASLPFKPKLTASTKGKASKADGANFEVKVESTGIGAGEHRQSRPATAKATALRASDDPKSVCREHLRTGAIYVATAGQPYPLKLECHGKETSHITLTNWNQPVSVSTPEQSIDINQAGGEKAR